jgi:hypothetical protein
MSAMSSDDLKVFRIRRAPSGGRKPAPGPDIEAKILDAAEATKRAFDHLTSIFQNTNGVTEPTLSHPNGRPAIVSSAKSRGKAEYGLRVSCSLTRCARG